MFLSLLLICIIGRSRAPFSDKPQAPKGFPGVCQSPYQGCLSAIPSLFTSEERECIGQRQGRFLEAQSLIQMLKATRFEVAPQRICRLPGSGRLHQLLILESRVQLEKINLFETTVVLQGKKSLGGHFSRGGAFRFDIPFDPLAPRTARAFITFGSCHSISSGHP